MGEATTLAAVAGQLEVTPASAIYGFDLSWSRVWCGREYWRSRSRMPGSLFVGELESIPLPDASFDVAFTCHAVEPNHGRESEILAELYRVARRYLVLFEPAYELADASTRARMEQHGYCRDLPGIARAAGWKVIEWRLLGTQDPQNPTGVLVIEKDPNQASAPAPVRYACPVCHRLLRLLDHYYCEHDGLVFPNIQGIPCLSKTSAILASKFGCCFAPLTETPRMVDNTLV